MAVWEGIYMFKISEVKEVIYSKFNNCNVIKYDDENGYRKFAACIEDLYVKCGDKVEIYTDEYVNYRGFGAMVLRVIK